MKNEKFFAVDPNDGRTIENSINVSSYSIYPYKLFSPFTYSDEIKIPVPRQEDRFSNSVEAIWQGLKIIDGKTDFFLFNRKPKKRKGIVAGHMYGDEVIGIVEARLNIYKPSYFFYIDNFVPIELKEKILERGLKSCVYFFDVGYNIDIQDKSRALAHSLFLKEYFDKYLDRRLIETRRKIDRCAFEEHIMEHDTLAEDIERALKLFRSSNELDKKLFNLVLDGEYDLPFLHQRYYDKLLREIL